MIFVCYSLLSILSLSLSLSLREFTVSLPYQIWHTRKLFSKPFVFKLPGKPYVACHVNLHITVKTIIILMYNHIRGRKNWRTLVKIRILKYISNACIPWGGEGVNPPNATIAPFYSPLYIHSRAISLLRRSLDFETLSQIMSWTWNKNWLKRVSKKL